MKLFTQILDASSKRRTIKNDYLLIEDNIVARTGIQKYTKRELGLGDSNEVINVMRKSEDVFDDDSIASYSQSPITIYHPKQFVDSGNHDKLAVGDLPKAVADQDNGVIRADLIVKTKKGLQAINDGLTQLSMGYTANIVLQDGVTDDGTPYQAIQKNIRINHIALVPKGRAGIAQLSDSVMDIEDFNNHSTEGQTVTIEEIKAGLAKLTDTERESVIGVFKPVQKLSDAEIQSQIETKANELAVIKAKDMATVMAKEIADKAIAESKEFNDVVTKARGYIKDYNPNAVADRRQVMLDVMKAAAANPTVKKLLDAMFGGVEPQTLSDSALYTGFNFITNMSKDLPYMIADNKTVVDHFSQSQKPATTMRIADAIKLTQCKVY